MSLALVGLWCAVGHYRGPSSSFMQCESPANGADLSSLKKDFLSVGYFCDLSRRIKAKGCSKFTASVYIRAIWSVYVCSGGPRVVLRYGRTLQRMHCVRSSCLAARGRGSYAGNDRTLRSLRLLETCMGYTGLDWVQGADGAVISCSWGGFFAGGRGSYAGTAAPLAAYATWDQYWWCWLGQGPGSCWRRHQSLSGVAFSFLLGTSAVVLAWTGSRGLVAPSSVALGMVSQFLHFISVLSPCALLVVGA